MRDGVVGEGVVFDVVEVGLVDEGAEEAEEPHISVGQTTFPVLFRVGASGWSREDRVRRVGAMLASRSLVNSASRNREGVKPDAAEARERQERGDEPAQGKPWGCPLPA